MDTAESHRNQNNVGIANMKQITVAAQFILDHQEQHKLSQVLMNQTPDIRPGEREEEKKIEQRRSDKKWRPGREQFLPVNLGSCLEDSGCFLPKFALLLRSLLNSLLFSSFILSCLPFSSLLLSSLVVASLYALLFLSSFLLWGAVIIFSSVLLHCLIRSALIFSFSFLRFRVFSFLFFIFCFYFSKNKKQIRKHHPPPYNGSSSFSRPELRLSPPAVRTNGVTSVNPWSVCTDLPQKMHFR